MWADSVALPLDVDAHGPSPALPAGQPRPASAGTPLSTPAPAGLRVRQVERGPRTPSPPTAPRDPVPAGGGSGWTPSGCFCCPRPPPPPRVCENSFAFVSVFYNFTCSQLPRAPLGRALKCAECGALSAAAATSEAASNAMLVPLIARPSARPPGSARLSYILFVL